jgi:uncharacterized protein (DUF2267 family)
MNEKEFIREVQRATGLSSLKEAERWANAVIGALADLAPDSQTRRQLVTQLPGSLKSRLQAEPRRALLMDRDALVLHVGAALDLHAPDARRALLAVWSVIRRAVSRGELTDFEARVPRDVAAFLEAAA